MLDDCLSVNLSGISLSISEIFNVGKQETSFQSIKKNNKKFQNTCLFFLFFFH